MAWLVKTKPLARYVPKVETTPLGQELHAAQVSYHEHNPGFFWWPVEFKSQGVLLPDELLPTAARVKSAHKSLPDMFNLNGLGVSERLKASIEALEPGVHQFKEVPVTMKDGSAAPGRYFATVLAHVAEEQVVLDQSTMPRRSDPSRWAQIPVPQRGDDGKIVIDRSKSPNWHIWYSLDIYRRLTISDELKRRWDALGVNSAYYVRLGEIGAADQRA